MENKKKFSSRLLHLRKDHKLSLAALGEILGISNQAVSLLEKGKNVPSFNVLIAIADYFDVSLDYLVGRSDTNSYLNKTVMKTGINSHTEELKDIYNSLDDDYKELLIRRARQIANMATNDLTTGMDKDA